MPSKPSGAAAAGSIRHFPSRIVLGKALVLSLGGVALGMLRSVALRRLLAARSSA